MTTAPEEATTRKDTMFINKIKIKRDRERPLGESRERDVEDWEAECVRPEGRWTRDGRPRATAA